MQGTLLDRLRGRYPIGPEVDGQPEFGFRQFDPVPIQLEAANEIERLQGLLSEFQKSEFHPDWSLLEASQHSIREHQKIMGEWREAIKDLTLAETPEEETDRLGTLLEMTGLLADL